MSVPAGNGPGWETVAVVHCQDGSNPPSPTPPLVLGTLLPHFISGKFSQLLAQTQGRISRRGVCVCSSLPPAPASCGELTGQTQGRRGCWGAAVRGVQPPRAACIAPLPGRSGTSPGLGPIPASALCTGTYRLTKHAATLHPVPITFSPLPRMESEGTSARRVARVLPLCPQAVLV